MGDKLPTTWETPEHTKAKHRIIATYLKAWIPILSYQLRNYGIPGNEPVIVDGFAGPGIYADGVEGSPIIALRTAASYDPPIPVPIRFIFIERDENRHESLVNSIEDLKSEYPGLEMSCNILPPICGECDIEIRSAIDVCFGKDVAEVGPAFFLLDQFGYSHVPMELVSLIMSHKMCEVLTLVNWNGMQRFLDQERIRPAINATYGDEEWHVVFDLSRDMRAAYMLEEYEKALYRNAGIEYVLHFTMCDRGNRPIYWLFFGTNHIEGLRAMKKALIDEAPNGDYRFSDKYDSGNLPLLSDYDYNIDASHLLAHFRGQTVQTSEVEKFVLLKTPHRLFRKALRELLRSEELIIIESPSNYRPGTFRKDDLKNIVIRFN